MSAGDHQNDERAASAARARESLAVRYRPARFADLVGQRHVAAVLRPLASHPPQQVLLTGGSGLGKTTVARIFAAAVNCEEPVAGDACGTCASCREIAAGTFPDVIELDAASNGGKDEIREMAQRAMTAPLRSRYRIYIVDEAHGLSRAGGEAFLKLLEEPPPHVIFLLATTDPDKMLATNRGRCLEFELVAPSRSDVVAHLVAVAAAEGVTCPAEVAGAVVDATDPALGLRGTLMNLAKVLPALGAGSLDVADAAALLGTAPTAGLADLTAAIAAHDRLRAFEALDAARAASSDPAVRAALLAWARAALRDAAGDPDGFDTARWRFEQVLAAPPGTAWTDAVVARLASPSLDPDPGALGALVDEAVVVAARLDDLLARAHTLATGPAAPLADPAGRTHPDHPASPTSTDAAADADAADPAAPSPRAPRGGGAHRPAVASPGTELVEVPDTPATDAPRPGAPGPEGRRPSPARPDGADPWFDDPAASETAPEPKARPSRPGPAGSGARRPARPKAEQADRTESPAAQPDGEPARRPAARQPRPPRQAKPDQAPEAPPRRAATGAPDPAPAPAPDTHAAERLIEAVAATSRTGAALLRECRISATPTSLVISVPGPLAERAREHGFQQVVAASVQALGLPRPSWRKHRVD